MARIVRRLVETLAIAIVYIATAQFGFLAATAPGNVTVVWPPSGIALAAMLLLGYHAWAGVWLGSFLVNVLFFIFHDVVVPTALTGASSIAVGSMLQALLAAFLYRRMIGPRIPHELKGVFSFMTLATMSCLVAPTVGVGSLAFSNAITSSKYPDTWLTWWLGDVVGILTIAPVLLMVGYKLRQGQGTRYLPFPLTNGGVGLCLMAGYNIWKLEDQGVTAFLGVSAAWLSWGVFAAGLLLAVLLASYIEHHLGIEAALQESEERSRRQLLELETLYRTAPIGLALVDHDLRFLRINEKLAEMNGVPMDAHIGHALGQVVPRLAQTIEPLYRRVFETGEPVLHIELHGTTSAQPNIERDWLVDYYPLKESDGSVQAVGVQVVEITARKRAEEELFNEKERAEVTLHCIGDGVITTDPSCRVEYLNPVAETLTGWTAEEARGKPVEVIFNIVEEQSQTRVPSPVARCLKDGTIVGLANHTVLISRSGQAHAIEDSVAPIRGREGEVLGAVLVFHDVTETRRMARQLQHDAAHDALTGLINRREFGGRLERAVASAKRYALHHALCYFDLDQFKLVNDTAGHAAGDELLKHVRGLLSGRFRERDTLARLGGDEFALLLENCGLDEAIRIAEIIVATFREWRFVWQGRTFHVGVSVGVVAINSDVESAAQLLSQADMACYAAKERGRNRVHVYLSADR